MTLLESLVALVILGLSAVGLLELFQEISSRTARIAAHARVLAVATATMERTLTEGLRRDLPSDSAGMTRHIEWRTHPTGLRELIVTVDLSAGAHVELHRLVAP